MKYLSLFSGIGGFELGIQQAYESSCNAHRSKKRGGKTNTSRDKKQGFFSKERKNSCSKAGRFGKRPTDSSYERPLCVGYSEIDKYATQIYQKHFPEHKNYGDIKKINEKELPDFDLLVGGFPCQSFSIAGKRKGFADTRGTLFFDIARILQAKQPRLLLLENVKGLLSHDNGRTFRTIISTLTELGYDIQWQVLNSKNFGVPQNRERVFIVGHLRGTPRPKVFPFTSDGGQVDELPRHITNTLTARYEGAQATGSYVGESKLNAQEIKQVNNPNHSNDRVYDSTGLSPTLNTMQGGLRQPKILAHYGHKNKPPVEMKISPTLKAQSHGHEPWVEYLSIGCVKNIRRLTPLECERLQGFDDNWTSGISDTQRYKCCGNAVTVNVIREIITRLI